ncbi:MAG: hypothetical protein ACRDJC_25170 [Thermomicrobiales bacterium]
MRIAEARLMPGRLAVRSSRPEGPRPFSSEWLAADAPPAPPRTAFRLPPWVPDGRRLSAGLMVTVSLVVAILAVQGGNRPARIPPATSHVIEAPAVIPAPTNTPAPQPTAALQSIPAPGDQSLAPAPAPEFVQSPNQATDPVAQVVSPPVDRPLLPEYRVVTFYGHPHDPAMGIVGEHAMTDLAAMLRQEAANYAAADPSRPVIPAFEVIATVAQRVPGADGTYILDTDRDTLTTYIDFAAEQGMLVVLDLQIGRGTVANEIEKVRDLLARPNVHLAIDPEFAVAEGQIPGEYIGSVTAESITYAQQVLAEISAANSIPPKLLIVHQFREDMIQNKEQLAPYPGVQLIIDADGYGAPELKTAVYNFLVRDEPIEFSGVKLFYRQDVPLMNPQEILALVPAPDVIIYQ